MRLVKAEEEKEKSGKEPEYQGIKKVFINAQMIEETGEDNKRTRKKPPGKRPGAHG